MTATLTPTPPELAEGSDTGVSNTDNLTNDASPTLAGSAVAGATITLYDTDGTTVLGTAVAGPTGAYAIAPTDPLDDGDHVLSVTAKAAGFDESPPSQGLDVTIDTAAPAAPTAPAPSPDSDTGASTLDGVTSATNLTLTGAAEPGATVQLFDGGGADPIASAVADADGAFTIFTGALDEGVHNLTATATDAAGNQSAASPPTAITVDTTAPATPPAPVLSPISDTGALHTDGVTSDRTLVITGTAEAGAKIQLFVSDTEANDALVGVATADASGAYAITTTPLASGPNALTVVATDAAGNASAVSAPLDVLIDTSPGTATSTPFDAPNNATEVGFRVHFDEAVGDVSPSDFGLTETGSAMGVVQNVVGSGRDYTVTVTGLSGAGGLSLSLNGGITDTAGNPVMFTESDVHTVAQTNTPSTTSVSGVSDGGLGSPSATGRAVAFDSTDGRQVADGPVGSFSNVYVKDLSTGNVLLVTIGADGEANGDSGHPSLSKNGTVIAFDSTATNLVPGGTTPGQLNTYVARLIRTKQGGVAALALVPGSITLVSQGNGQQGGGVEGIGPVVSPDGAYVAFSSTASLLPGVETGISNVYLEDIATGALTLVSAGTGQNGAPGQGGSSDSYVTSISSSPAGVKVAYESYATDLGGAPLSPGSFFLEERGYVFDATSGATTVLDGVGTVGGDTATDDYATIHPSLSENGNFVGFTVQHGQTGSTVYETDLRTNTRTQVSPDGDYADDASLSDGGSYVLYVNNLFGHDPGQSADELTLFDTASKTTTTLGQEADGQIPRLTDNGNAVVFNGGDSAAPSVYETSLGVSVGINPIGSADVVNAAELKQIEADGGMSVSGVTDAPAGSAVIVKIGDAATETFSAPVAGSVTGAGVWTAVIPADRLTGLSDQLYVITAQIGTSAGSTILTPRFFNIETAAPPTPDAPALAAQSDTGAAHDGAITDQDTPTLRGLAQPGATVTLYDAQAPLIAIGTGVADANGVYAIIAAQGDGSGLTQGAHSLFVTATDVAGNASAPSATFDLTVDTVAPDQPGLPVLAPGSDTGESSVDGVTSVAQPTVTGKAEAGVTVTLYDSDGVAVLGTAIADAKGDYAITSSALTDGQHRLSVTATDAAGNVSPRSQTVDLTIDTEPPAAPLLQAVTGSTVSQGQLAPEVEVSGVAEPFSTVVLHADGDAAGSGKAQADAFGAYTIDSDPLQAGDHTLTVTAIDQAGNESQASLPQSVTISGTPVIPPNQTLFDDGKAADGYIVGATVFGDANGNGVLDPGESLAVTDLSGGFRSYATTALVLTGGVDVSTGLTLPGVLKAPAESHAITALTTFLVAYEAAAPAGLLLGQYAAAAAAALGLPSSASFEDDPIADALAGSPGVEILNAKLSDMAVDFSAVIAGAGGDAAVAFGAVFNAVARAALAQGPLDLDDSATLSAILVDAAHEALPGVTLSADVVAAAGQVVAAGNAVLDLQQGSSGGTGLLSTLAGDEFVAQSSAAAALEQAVQAPGLLPSVVADFTGGSLAEAGAAAATQALGAPQLTAASDTGLSQADDIIDTLTPTFTGTAKPGSTVILADNNYQNRPRTAVVIGVGTADATGHYSIRVSSLTNGGNQVFAQTVTGSTAPAVGGAFAVTDPLTTPSTYVYVETTASDTLVRPAILATAVEPGPGDDSTHAMLLVYGIVSGDLPRVTVYADGASTPIGSGLASAGDDFGIQTSALSAGPHVLTVTATFLGGYTLTSAPFTLTVNAPVTVSDSRVVGAGAIADATAFYATDDGHVAPTLRDVSAQTSNQGAVSLPLDRYSPMITVQGGWDTLTDLPLGGGAPDLAARDGTINPFAVAEFDSTSTPPELLAPAGSAMVTPLTSLVAASGVATATADQTIATALGLDGTDLLSLDPVRAALAGDPRALLASAKVIDTVTLESALFGFSYKSLSSALLSGPFNLDSESDILGQLQAQYRFNQNAPDTAFLTAVATVIAASNADIDAHAAAAPVDEVAYALAAEVQAQTLTAPAIADIFTAVQDLPDLQPASAASQIAALETSLVHTYSGAALTTEVAAVEAESAQVLAFGPAGAATTNASVVHFTITFAAPVGGLTAADFAVVEGSGLSDADIIGVTPTPGGGGATYDISVQTGIGTGALSLTFTPGGLTNALGKPLTSGLFESPIDTNPVSVRAITVERGIAAGDFNADGRPDLVSISAGDASEGANLTTYLNQGGGKVAAQPGVYVPLELDAVAVGDANGDGKSDIIVGGLTYGGGLGGIGLLLGNGDGTFQNAVDVSDIQASTLAVGALDGTGRLDIVANVLTGSASSETLKVTGALQVLLGRGDGTFQSAPELSLGAGATVSQVIVGDMNGDGARDIVALDSAHGAIDVFLGNGDGTFQAPIVTQIAAADQTLSGIAIGDLNGDGVNDIVAALANNQNSLADRAVAVLLGDGNGAFQAAKTFAFPASQYGDTRAGSSFLAQFSPSEVSVADINNDGKADVVVGGHTGTVVLLGQGDGGLTLGEQMTVGNAASGDNLVTVDLNQDGRTDIITPPTGADGNTIGVGVSLNAPSTVLPAASTPVTVTRSAVADPLLTVAAGDAALSRDGQTYTLDLGTLTEGQAATPLQIALTNFGEAPTDSLDGRFGSLVGGGFTVTGAALPAALATGESYSGLTFTADTSAIGGHSATLTFAPLDVSATTTTYAPASESDGTVVTTTSVDGANVAAELPPITLVVKDTVVAAVAPPENPAILSAPGSIAFANARVGDAVSQPLAVENAAVFPADSLDVSAIAEGAATVTGSASGLGPGVSDSQDITVGLDTGAAGQISGSVVLAPTSVGPSGSQTSLPTDTVSVSGAVFRTAEAQPAQISEIIHVGDPGAVTLDVANIAPADGYSEDLVASVADVTGAIGASGSSGEIAPGADSGAGLQATVSTAQAGQIAGTVELSLASDGGTGAGALDGLGQVALPSQNLAVNVTVDNYAQATLVSHAGKLTAGAAANSYELDLGTAPLGGAALSVDLAALNSAIGIADTLGGAYSISGDSAFANTGFGAFTGDPAGQSDAGGVVTLATDKAGTFTETLTLTPSGANSGGYSAALPTQTVTITGTVAAPIMPAPAMLGAPATIVFGNARVGDTLNQPLAIENDADAPAAALDVAATAAGDATVTGGVSALAAGASDDKDIVVGLGTAAAGAASGSITLAPATDGGAGSPVALPDQSVAVSGTVFRVAEASAAPISEVVHVGDPGTVTVDVANIAPADGYSEDLVASVAGVTGAIGASGSSGEIAPGANSGAGLQATVSTAQAGQIAGTVELSLASDGGTGAGALDGLGQVALPSQTVAVNVTVDNYAKATLVSHKGVLTAGAAANSYRLDLGTVQLGATAVSVDLAALNSAIGIADTLGGAYAISGDPAFTNTGFGTFSGDAAGQSDAGGVITLNTDEAGSFAETLTLTPTGANASGYSGALPTQTVTVVGKVAAPPPAPAMLAAPASVTFANARVDDVVSQPLAIENDANPPADPLDVTATAAGEATVAGSVTGLAAGATDDKDIVVGLETATAGVVSGSVTLAPTSVDDSGPSTALPDVSAPVMGKVFRAAEATTTPISEIVHVGDAGTATIDVGNAAAADGYSENLVASVAGVSGAIAAAGSTGEIAPGADSGAALQATFSTAQAGVISGSVALSLVSDGGTGPGAIDGLGQVTLPSQTVAVSITVDNHARATLVSQKGVLTPGATANSFVLNLGTTPLGGAALSVDLAALNNAAGLADTLSGVYAISGDAAFANTGFKAFSGDTAGQSDAGGVITLSTGKAGTYTETLTLTPTGANVGGFSESLPTETVTITGVVAPPTGSGRGDVHIVTFDGRHYDFQAVGDFVLARSTDPDPAFLIQIRTAEWEDEGSLTMQLAARVGGDVVRFDAEGSALVSIDGVDENTLAVGQTEALSGGTLTRTSAETYRVLWANGESLAVTDQGHYLDEAVSLAPGDGPGSVQGLLGPDEGQASDFTLPDGTVLKPPVSTAELLGEFADAWRVSASASILSSLSSTAAGPTASGGGSDVARVILFGQLSATAAPAAGDGVAGSMVSHLSPVPRLLAVAGH